MCCGTTPCSDHSRPRVPDLDGRALGRPGARGTLVPATAVPYGHEHLVRPVLPMVTQPVIAVLRKEAGPAETALLELLREEAWSESIALSRASLRTRPPDGHWLPRCSGRVPREGRQPVDLGVRHILRHLREEALGVRL